MSMPDEEKEEKRGFKVEDRRRFSDTGEPRAEPAQGASDSQSADRPTDFERDSAASSPAAERHADDPSQLEMTFSTFVLSLSTQALAHLGEIPNPIDNQTIVDMGAAKQLIDILGLLKEKTKGNLDKTENGLLESVLYDLRLRYVEHVRGHA
jgi:hypothetical protein